MGSFTLKTPPGLECLSLVQATEDVNPWTPAEDEQTAQALLSAHELQDIAMVPTINNG